MAIIKEQATSGHGLSQIPGQISMSNEIRRKLIHLGSISIPVVYWFLSQETALSILVPMTLIAIVTEILRRAFPGFERWFRSFFGPLLRPHESSTRPEINGATFVLISACLCIAIFPKIIAITSFAVLIISDTASALYGRRFGKREFLRKSVEGSGAFFVTAVIVVFVVAYLSHAPREFVAFGGLASLVAMVVEGLSEGGSSIDDNMTIPMAFGAVMWGGLELWQTGLIPVL
ncbi:MAG: dolichol kinase [Chlorobi bacterium]|nr:dolichol kinase [Chlorobiota bacterium]